MTAIEHKFSEQLGGSDDLFQFQKAFGVIKAHYSYLMLFNKRASDKWSCQFCYKVTAFKDFM